MKSLVRRESLLKPVYFSLLCDRCGKFYRTSTGSWHCLSCFAGSDMHGLTPLQLLGELSGS